MLIALVICVVGVVQIYSATLDTSSHSDWWRQALDVVSGLGTDVAGAHHRLPHAAALCPHAVPRLGGCRCWQLTSVGEAAFGSTRWIPLPGGFHLQVSEFVKLVIILLVARYLTDLHRDDLDIWDTLKLAGLVLVPAALVLMQPDLGTALTYVAILLVGVFLAGLHWKYIAVLVMCGCGGVGCFPRVRFF